MLIICIIVVIKISKINTFIFNSDSSIYGYYKYLFKGKQGNIQIYFNLMNNNTHHLASTMNSDYGSPTNSMFRPIPLESLNSHHSTITTNLNEIKAADTHLQTGISQAKQRLLKGLSHQNSFNGAFFDTRRYVHNDKTVMMNRKQTSSLNHASKWNSRLQENQKNVTNINPELLMTVNNRTREHAFKKNQDHLYWQQVIRQKNQRINFLESELSKISQQIHNQLPLNSRNQMSPQNVIFCKDCEINRKRIAQLQAKIAQMISMHKKQHSKMSAQLEKVTSHRQTLSKKIADLESINLNYQELANTKQRSQQFEYQTNDLYMMEKQNNERQITFLEQKIREISEQNQRYMIEVKEKNKQIRSYESKVNQLMIMQQKQLKHVSQQSYSKGTNKKDDNYDYITEINQENNRKLRQILREKETIINKNDQLEQIVFQKRTQNAFLQAQNQEMNNLLTEKAQQIQNLHYKVQEMMDWHSQKIEDQRTAIAHKKDEQINQLRNRISSAETQIEGRKSQDFMEYERQLAAFQYTLNLQTNQIQQKQQQNQQLRKLVIQLEGINERLNESLPQSNRKSEQLDNLISQIISKERKIFEEQLTKMNESLQQSFKQNQVLNQMLEKQKEQKQRKNQVLQQIQRLNYAMREKNRQNENLKQKIFSMQEHIEMLISRKQPILAQEHALQKKYKITMQTIERIQDRSMAQMGSDQKQHISELQIYRDQQRFVNTVDFIKKQQYPNFKVQYFPMPQISSSSDGEKEKSLPNINERHNTTFKELKQKILSAQITIDNLTDDLLVAQQQLVHKQQEIKDLYSELQKLNNKNQAQISEKIQQLQKYMDNLIEENKALGKQKDSAQNQIHNLLNQNKDLINSKSNIEHQIHILLQQNQQLTNNLADAENYIAKLEGDRNDSSISDKVDYHRLQVEITNVRNQYQQKLKDLIHRNQFLEQSLKITQNQLSAIEQKNKKQEIGKQDNSQYQKQNKELKEYNIKLMDQVRAFEDQILIRNLEVKKQQQNVINLEKQVQNAIQQRNDYLSKLEKAEDFIKLTLDQKQNLIDAVNQREETLKKIRQDSNAQLQFLIKENEEKTIEIGQLYKNISELKKQLAQKQKDIPVNVNTESDNLIEILKQENQTKQNEIFRLSDCLRLAEGQLKNERSQSQIWKDRSEKQIKKLEQENQNLINEINMVQEESQNNYTNLENAEKYIIQIEGTLSEQKQVREKIQRDYHQKLQQINVLQDSIRDMKQNKLKDQTKHEQNQTNRVIQLQKQLENSLNTQRNIENQKKKEFQIIKRQYDEQYQLLNNTINVLQHQKDQIKKKLQENADTVSYVQQKLMKNIVPSSHVQPALWRAKFDERLGELHQGIQQNEFLRQKMSQLEKDTAQKTEVIRNLQKAIESYNVKIQQKSPQEHKLQQINKLNNDINNLSAINKQLTSQITTLQVQLANQANQANDLAAQVQANRNLSAELSNERNNLAAQVQANRNLSAELSNERNNLAAQVQANRNLSAELSNERNNLAAQVQANRNLSAELSNERNNLRIQIQASRNIQVKNDELIFHQNNMQQTIKQLQEELGKEKDKLANQISINTLLEEKLGKTDVAIPTQNQRVDQKLSEMQQTVNKLRQENEQLKFANEEQNRRIQDLEYENERVKRDFQRATNDVIQMQFGPNQQVAYLEQQLEQAKKQAAINYENLIHAEKYIEENQNKFQAQKQYAQQLQIAQTQIQNLLHQKNQIQKDSQNLQKTLQMSSQQLNQVVRSLQQQNLTLKKQKDQKQQQLSKTQAELAKSLQESHNITQISEKDKQVEDVNKMMADLQNKVHYLSQDNQRLAIQVSSTQNENQNLVRQIKSISQENQSLRRQNKSLDEGVQDIQLDYQNRMSELQKINEQEVNRMMQNLEKADKQIVYIESEIERLEKQNTELRQSIVEQEQIKNQTNHLQNRFAQQENYYVEQIKKLNDDLSQIEGEKYSLIRNTEELQATQKQFSKKIDQIAKERDNLFADVNQFIHQVKTKNQEIATLKELQNKLQNDLQQKNLNLRSFEEKYSQLQQALKHTQQKNEELRREAQDWQTEAEQKKRVINTLQNEAVMMRNQMQSLGMARDQAAQELHVVILKIKEAENHIDFLEGMINEHNKNLAKVEESNRRSNQLQEKIRILSQSLEALSPNSLMDKIETMDKDFAELSDRFMTMIEDEKKKIYQSFIREHPEKQQFLRVEQDGQVILTQIQNQGDVGMLEELNEKLLSIEREKQILFLQLQKMESLRESQIKLHEAQQKISALEDQLKKKGVDFSQVSEWKQQDSFDHQISQQQESPKDINTMQKIIDDLKNEVNEKDMLLRKFEHERQQIAKNTNQLHEQIKKMRQQCHAIDENELSAKVNELQKQLQLQKSASFQEISDKNEQIQELQQKLAQLESQKADEGVENESGEAASPRFVSLQQINKEKSDELDLLKTKNRQLENEIAELKQNIETQRIQQNSLVEKLQNAYNKLQDVGEEAKKVQESYAELKNNYEKQAQIIQENVEANEERTNYQAIINNKQQQIHQYQSQISQLQQKIHNLSIHNTLTDGTHGKKHEEEGSNGKREEGPDGKREEGSNGKNYEDGSDRKKHEEDGSDSKKYEEGSDVKRYESTMQHGGSVQVPSGMSQLQQQLEFDRDRIKKENVRLQQQLEQQSRVNDYLRENIESLQKNEEQYKNQINRLHDELREQIQKYQQFRQNNDEANNQVLDQIKKQFEELKKQKSQKELQVEQQRIEIQKLNVDLQVNEAVYVELQKKFIDLNDQLETQKQQYQQKQVQNDQQKRELLQKLSSLQSQLTEKQEEIGKLKQQLSVYQQKYENLEKDKQEIEETKKQNQRLSQQYQEISEKIEAAYEVNFQLHTDKNQISNNLALMEQKILSFSSTLNIQKHQKNNSEDDQSQVKSPTKFSKQIVDLLEKAAAQVVKLEQENQRLREQIESNDRSLNKDEEIGIQSNVNTSQKENVKEEEKPLHKSDFEGQQYKVALQAKVEELQKQIIEEQAKIQATLGISNTLRDQNIQLQDEIARMQTQLKKLQEEYALKKDEVDGLVEQIMKLKLQKQNQHQKLQKQIEEINVQLEESKQKDQYLKKQHARMILELEDIEKTLKAKNEERERRKKQNEREKDKKEKEKNNNDREQKIGSADLDRLRMLERLNYQLEQQIKTFQATIDTLNSELEVYQNKQQQWIEQQEKQSHTLQKVSKINEMVANFDGKSKYTEEQQQREQADAQKMQPQWLQSLNDTIAYKLKFLADQIHQKDEQINRLQNIIEQSDERQDDKEVRQVIQGRYEQLLEKLIQYEGLNKRLTEEVERLSEEVNEYKIQVDEFSKQVLDSSNENNNSSAENLSLRKKLENVEYEMLKMKQSGSLEQPSLNILGGQRTARQESFEGFLRMCLHKVSNLEQSMEEIQKNLDGKNFKFSLLIGNVSGKLDKSRSYSSENLKRDLDEIENNLLQNERQLNDSIDKVEIVIRDVREIISNPNKPIDKLRVTKLLDILQKNLKENQELHEKEMENIIALYKQEEEQRSKYSSPNKSHKRRISENQQNWQQAPDLAIQNNDDLIREIKELHKLTDLYHNEAQKRKSRYIATIEKLEEEVERLKTICGERVIMEQGEIQYKTDNDLVNKLTLQLACLSDRLKTEREQYSKEDEQDNSGFDELGQEDVIVGGQGAKDSDVLIDNIKDSFNQSPVDQKLNRIVKLYSQASSISNFIELLLDQFELSRSQVFEMRRKAQDIVDKETKQNLQYLRSKENQIEQILKSQPQRLPQQSNHVIQKMARNLMMGDLINIFETKNTVQLIQKIEEVVNSVQEDQQMSKMRERDSDIFCRQIEQIKRKYYPKANQFSDSLVYYLRELISATEDEDFFSIIDGIFKNMSEMEKMYIYTLQEKDKFVAEHNQLLKKLLERSSSDDSEDFRAILDEQGGLQIKQSRHLYSDQKLPRENIEGSDSSDREKDEKSE